jgi:hypothetical protein
MKRYLLFSSVLVCLSIVAATIRSNLGASATKNIEQTAPFKNPYVTDGLVAMWDGEWNAGQGRHASSSKGWIDLINGLYLSQDRNLFFDKDSLSHGKYAISVESPIMAELTADAFTFTIVFSRNSIPRGDAEDELIFMPTVSGKAWYQRIARIYSNSGILPNFALCRGTYNSALSRIAQNMQCLVNVRYSYTFIFGIGYFKAYVGDVLVIDTVDANFKMTDGNGQFLSGNKGTDGNDYNIRFYNRALLSDEISHNYAVDKERFGL